MPPTNREAHVLDLQINRSMPVPAGLQQGQNLLIPSDILAKRLMHFAEEVYNVEPESALGRWMKVLLGDAGAGYLRKKVFITRLQESLSGTHFFDLDRFYGALFAVGRRNGESLTFDPYTELATYDEWEHVHTIDASYRSRVEQFARAIGLGATPAGIEAIAEALLAVDVDIYEDYYRADRVSNTWADLEGEYSTWGDIDGETYDFLEGGDGDLDNTDRFHFRVTPKRPISLEEQYALVRAITRFRPAFTNFSIDVGGADAFDVVPIQAAWADSEYWEVRRQVIPAPGTDSDYGITAEDLADTGRAEPRRPPFTDYQGEAWSYNADVMGVSSYILGAGQLPYSTPDEADFHLEGLPITLTDIWERIKHNDNSWTDYNERLALRTDEEIIAGRAASEGVLLSHTYMSRTDKGVPVQFGDSGLPAEYPPMYVDRARIDSALARSAEATRLSNLHYWSTPPQPQSSLAAEVLEIRFRDDKLVNYFSFEAPRFPHVGFVQYLSSRTGTWKTLYQYLSSESFPQRVIARVEANNKQHPQHDFAGHWQKYSASFGEPVVANRFRVVMQRGSYSDPPVDHRLAPLPYSLGLRRIDLGYRVRGRDDAPNYPNQPPAGWASTKDVLGSRVYFDLRTRPGSNVLNEESAAWWSEPMPIPDSVASLYLDVRQSNGAPQIIDRFWIEPVTEGVPFNLYWSDGEVVDRPFTASDSPIDYPAVNEVGFVEAIGEGMWVHQNSSVEIDNAAVQFDPARKWWLGMKLRVRTSPANGTTNIGLYESDSGDGLALTFDADSLNVTVTQGGYPVFDDAVLDASFNDDDVVTLALSYDPSTKTLTAYYKHATDTEVTSSSVVLDDPLSAQPERLVFGSATTEGFVVHSLVIKQGLDFNADDFYPNANNYPLNSIWSISDDHHTDNAILRYHRTFIGGPKSSGFRGGAGQYMEQIAWTLVPRTYRLYKGFIQMPPVKAKFFKFEFTSLAPRWYEPFLPIVRRVRRFPAGLEPSKRKVDGAFEAYPGLTTTLNKLDEFVDRPGLQSLSAPGKPSPTAALYAADPVVAANLAEKTWQYRFMEWRPDLDHSAWWQTGFHNYQEIEVLHDQKISFQVAIKTIQAYRLNFEANDDTMVYRDSLHDLRHINRDTMSWSAQPGYLFSSVVPSVVESKPYNSRHNVQAIQFATQQTPAVQLLPNDDFRDPATARDSTPRRTQYINTGSLLRVTTWYATMEEVLAAVQRASVVLSSTATGAPYPHNLLLDNSQSWTLDEWVGSFVEILSGNGAGDIRLISSNTSDTLYVAPNWSGDDPDSTSTYEVFTVEDSGTVDATPSNDIIQDTLKTWVVDEWAGKRIRIVAGTGVGQERTVASNTIDTVTADSPWSPDLATDSEYEIQTIEDSGTADDPVASTNTLVDATQDWVVNQWAGYLVHIVSGIGAGQSREISTNTGDTLVVTSDWDTNPDETSHYTIELNNYTIVENLDTIDVEWPIDQDAAPSWRYFFDIRRPISKWHSYGDARMDHLAAINMVSVTRDNSSGVSFPGSGNTFPHPPGDPVSSFRFNDQPQGIDVGGIESPKVVVSPRGSVAAAVRLSTEDFLSEPLRLQIVAADDVTVLAEKVFTPAPGEIVEEYVEYHIGDNYADGSLLTFELRNVVDNPFHPVFMSLDPLEPIEDEMGHLFRVRLIQEGNTNDQWKVDRLSLFDESILWEFSNNGGTTFHEVIGDIRSNPNGLHTFPTRGRSLVWRATAYRKRMALTSIQIRPWYEGFVNYRHTVPQRGANVSVFDQDPPIDEDPEFRMWHHIVPRHWFLTGQRYPLNAMPLGDQPVITEYQRQFVDNMDEDISGIDDEATRGVLLARDIQETATATDSVSRSLVLGRDVDEEAPATDSRPEIESITGDWEIS